MCLISKNVKEILKEDLLVYKAGNISQCNNFYVSPYQRFTLPFNKLCNDEVYEIVNIVSGGTFLIGQGFFHSFLDKESVEKWQKAQGLISNGIYRCHSYKCIIPKGTICYKGVFKFIDAYHNGSISICNAIASKSIIVLNKEFDGYKEILSEYNLRSI